MRARKRIAELQPRVSGVTESTVAELKSESREREKNRVTACNKEMKPLGIECHTGDCFSVCHRTRHLLTHIKPQILQH